MKPWQVVLVVFLAAVFFGGAGLFIGYRVGVSNGQRSVSTRMVEIVVAARPFEHAMVMKPEMLTTISIPESEVTEAMIWSYDIVLGCVARYDISQGTPIAHWMIYCLDDPLPSSPGSSGR